MLVLLSGALAVIAFMLMTVLHASILLSLVSLLAAAGGITLWILKKRLPKIAVSAGGILCTIISALVLIPAGNMAGSIYGYTSSIEDIQKALEAEKYDQARILLEQTEEQYGADDNTVYLSVIRMIAENDYEGAYNKAEQLSDHTSKLYYTMKEQIYKSDPSETALDDLCKMYVDAAKDHPDWLEMKKKAGIAQIQGKNYESAMYFLENALIQNTEDAEIYYYLGVANYYMSSYETAKNCFANALEYSLSDSYSSDLLWYLKQMEQGEQEADV